MSHYGQVMSQTRQQERTRLAIVTAAIETWADDRQATLSQIAAAAGMGRSTVHRYFADRDDLLAAVDRECQRRFVVATLKARPGDGPGLEACLRLCEELLGLGPVLGLIFTDNPLVDPDSWSSGDTARDDGARPNDSGDADDSDEDDPFVLAVVRGQQDGTVDPALPIGWAVTVLWMLLSSAWLYLTSEQASRRDVSALLARTVAGALRSSRSNR